MTRQIRGTRQKGQVIVLVTLSLFAMCGLMALAIDLGWSYFVKQAAQGAADAAAVSAAAAGLALSPGTPPYTCGNTATTLTCTNGAITSCSAISNTSNLYKACQYAANNSFQDGTNNISVTVAANVTSPAPTVPNVVVSYWVTVRVTQVVPQLFAAMAGNPRATISARATAAITRVVFNASITLLNRENDPNPDPKLGKGVDLSMQGGGTVVAPGGMILASNLHNGTTASTALLGGSSKVTQTPYSWFRDTGTCVQGNGSTCDLSHWSSAPTYGKSDGTAFWDPTSISQLGQPPLAGGGSDLPVTITGNGGNAKAILGANNPPGTTGNGNANNPYILPAGNYFAATKSGNTYTGTGDPIVFDKNSYYKFQGAGSFPQYVFYGGLKTNSGAANITFTPGAYVFNGTKTGVSAFQVDNNTVLTDTNSGNGSYAGEIFIYTSPNNSVYGSALTPPSALSGSALSSLNFGETGIKSGNCSNCSITLNGLDPVNAPVNLRPWAPFLMWQDRANSYISYTANGQIDGQYGGSCSSGTITGGGTPDINNPCATAISRTSTSPRMNLYASPTANMTGALYQPRGAWLDIAGGGLINGSLKIVTGAILQSGSSSITLNGLGAPITVNTTALIE